MEYGYYTDIFGGNRIPADAFRRVCSESYILLEGLIYPRCVGKLGAEAESSFKQAVCCQAEYIYDNGSFGCESETEKGIKSERIGDYFVEYDTEKSGGGKSGDLFTVGGGKISPSAAGILKNAGLLSRWV